MTGWLGGKKLFHSRIRSVALLAERRDSFVGIVGVIVTVMLMML